MSGALIILDRSEAIKSVSRLILAKASMVLAQDKEDKHYFHIIKCRYAIPDCGIDYIKFSDKGEMVPTKQLVMLLLKNF